MGAGGPCQQLRRGISEAAAAAGAALADSDVSVSNAALQAIWKVSSSRLLGNNSNLVNSDKDQQILFAILLCLHAAPLIVCITYCAAGSIGISRIQALRKMSLRGDRALEEILCLDKKIFLQGH